MSSSWTLPLVALVAASLPALAVQSRVWTPSPTELQNGHAEGVAVTDRGRLFLAPRITRLGGDGPSGRAAHVWSAASDSRGNLYLGTGPDGRIVKLDPEGNETVLHVVPEPMVTALAVLADGTLLAGTAPGGKIYRFRPGGGANAEIYCDTEQRYVWSLAVSADGTVYAGTGDRGIVLEVGRSGRATPVYDTDEAHVTALVSKPDGSLVAGGAGRGLVYRIARDGTATVVYDGDLAEVAEIVAQADGSHVVALVAPPEADPRPPAVRIQVPQSPPVGASPDNVVDMEDRNAPTLEGIIEGLSGGAADARAGRRVRGKLIRIATDGSTRELWRSTFEAPLALALDEDGLPVFGTGEPGRVYRVREDGELELLADVRESQITGLVPSGSGLVAVTSNPAGAYRLDRRPADSGTYVSPSFDAQGPARWGTVRWRLGGEGNARVELQARTGNCAEPDSTWSDWGPLVKNSLGESLSVPDGRFLQWRARLAGDALAKSRLDEVSVTYSPYNRAPSLENFRLEATSAVVRGPATYRWTASDPDGDAVAVEIRYRSAGGGEWKTATRYDPAPTAEGEADSDSWKDGKATWDTAIVPEGSYDVQAIASDQGANPPGSGKDFVVLPTLRLAIDRTAPEIRVARGADGALEVTAVDEVGPIRRLEVLEGARLLESPAPLDGVCDSGTEAFRLSREEAGVGGRTLRALDGAGNSSSREIPPAGQEETP